MCDLDEAEVLPIAEHEYVLEIAPNAAACCGMRFATRYDGMIELMPATSTHPESASTLRAFGLLPKHTAGCLAN